MDLPPKVYNECNDFQINDGISLINSIDCKLGNGDIVLDIGCGSGNLTKILAQKFRQAHIVAIDTNDEMIVFAKSNNHANNISYYVCDISKQWNTQSDTIRSLEGRVVVVFTNYCLHWIIDKENTVLNMKRLLRTNSRVYAIIAWITQVRPSPSDDLVVPSKQRQQQIWLDHFADNGFRLLSSGFYLDDQFIKQDDFDKYFLPMAIAMRKMYIKSNNYLDDGTSTERINRKIETYLRGKCQLIKREDGQDYLKIKYGFFQFIFQLS